VTAAIESGCGDQVGSAWALARRRRGSYPAWRSSLSQRRKALRETQGLAQAKLPSALASPAGLVQLGDVTRNSVEGERARPYHKGAMSLGAPSATHAARRNVGQATVDRPFEISAQNGERGPRLASTLEAAIATHLRAAVSPTSPSGGSITDRAGSACRLERFSRLPNRVCFAA
jgi:hypothetical protein